MGTKRQPAAPAAEAPITAPPVDYDFKTLQLGTVSGQLRIPRSAVARWEILKAGLEEFAGDQIRNQTWVICTLWEGEAPWPAQRHGQPAQAWIDEVLEFLQDAGATLIDIMNVGTRVFNAVNGGRALTNVEAQKAADFSPAQAATS